MIRNGVIAVVLPLLLGPLACAGEQVPPKALVDARIEYVRAKDGIAMQLDPTDVHEADLALQRAEMAWQRSPGDATSLDLAVIAQRKAMIAESEATALKAREDAKQAATELEAWRSGQLQTARGQLNQTRQTLGQTEAQIQQQQTQLQQQRAMAAEQQQKLRELEGKLKDARDTIAKIASVKDDDRGMVITLQGEVLFRTAKWELKPGALAKLDQIADALKGKEQPILVVGHTDSVGAHDMNMDLSQKRAGAVRDYLVAKGIPTDLVQSQARGPDEPVSDNTSVEGRSANRRVEIIVQPKRP
jgi:outer membrane protein OmpA-like peptidoglycan-associated protein